MPRAAKQQVELQPVDRRDLDQATRWGRALLAMVERRPEVAEELGISREQIEHLRFELDKNEGLIPTVPSARAMYLAALSGQTTREEVLTRHHATIKAVHALSPMAAYVLASKLDNEKAPGSTRVALEIAKGTGVLVAAEPIKPKERHTLLAEEELREKSDDELRNELLDDV